MQYKCRKFLIFIRYYSDMGHYLFFLKLPSFFIYISSFPTVYKKKFHLCDQKTYKSILGVWQRNMLKPNFVRKYDDGEEWWL